MTSSTETTRILHVVTAPESFAFMRGQPAYMRARGYELAGASSPGPLTAIFRQEGVQVFEIAMARRITPVRDLASLWQLIRCIRAFRPAIVHAHTPKGGLLGMIAATLAGVKHRVYTIHGLPFVTRSGFNRWLLMTTERVSCFLASRVLCVSASIRDVAIENGLVPARKIATLASGSANGVDANGVFRPTPKSRALAAEMRVRLGIPADAKVVAFVGRVVKDKGIVELARAWDGISREGANVHLLIVGPIEPFDPVPADTLNALERDPRVHLLGRIEELRPVYAMASVVALPTHREGFGIVVIEAGAMNVPVVVSDIPGCVDAVVDGVTGTLVPAGDATALEVAVQRYLDDPALAETHGNAGRERVVRLFAQETVWAALANEYDILLGRRGEE